jgi:hypothetical protein
VWIGERDLVAGCVSKSVSVIILFSFIGQLSPPVSRFAQTCVFASFLGRVREGEGGREGELGGFPPMKSQRAYIKCQVVAQVDFDATQLMNCLTISVRQLYGIAGTSKGMDLLTWDNGIFILRTWKENADQIASAIPSISNYAGQECRFTILEKSSFLHNLTF